MESEELIRIVVLVGTRPELVKLAPVVHALRRRSGVRVVLGYTGQHTDLVRGTLRDVLAAFSLDFEHEVVARPGPSRRGVGRRTGAGGASVPGRALDADFDLDLMRPGQDLYHLAHGILDGVRDVVRKVRPDAIVVEGDTATVFFGALVGFFERVRVAHVEAGLRSGNRWSPFPEEMFRRLTDVVADFRFAPTLGAAENLAREGARSESVFVTGNTVVDAVRAASGVEREPRNPVLAELLASGRDYVLLTAHRRESFGEPMREIFEAVKELCSIAPGLEVLYPVHPNPRVSEPAEEMLASEPRVHLVPPLDYLDLLAALQGARFVLTDSGGIQEEAPTLGVPVLVLRDVTERPEGVEAGVATLVGTDRRRIVREARSLLEGRGIGAGTPGPTGLYGDGRASERIADVMISRLTGEKRRTTDWVPAGTGAPAEEASVGGRSPGGPGGKGAGGG